MAPGGKSKSIWRSQDAQHFTLVHRSQRDPLIHDPDASSRVLAPTQRRNAQRGQPLSRKELEEELLKGGKERENVGEAANYGIYYDDTQYDYMQHLRPMGGGYNARRGGKDEEEDVDVIMLPGPSAKQGKGKGKAKAGGQLDFKDDQKGHPLQQTPEDIARRERLGLPAGVLPSQEEMERDWAKGTEAAKEEGLRPDLDPHLRQVLEALDDDAFLAGRSRKQANVGADTASGSQDVAQFDEGDEGDDDDDDDFDALFGEVIAGGEYDPTGADEDEAWRNLPPEGDEALYLTAADKAKKKLSETGIDSQELSLSERVALFKEGLVPGAGAGAPAAPAGNTKVSGPGAPSIGAGKSRRAPSSVGGSSIFGDAPGKRSKPGSKARHAMSFYAPSADGGSTAWSMSSSAMARNEGLRGIDDQFDRMTQIYEAEDEEDDDLRSLREMRDDDDEEDEEDEDGGGFVREDFEAILDDFLSKHEVIGGKLKQRLGAPDSTATEKLDILRKEIGDARLEQWLNEKEESQEEIDKDIEGRIRVVGIRKNEWDVETIQTTKTNVSNHPRLLSHSGRSNASGVSSFRPATLGSNASMGSLSNGSSAGGSQFESIPKVKINKRTGVPEVVGWTKQRKGKGRNEVLAERNGLTAAAGDGDDNEEEEAAIKRFQNLKVSIDDAGDDDDDGSGPPPSAMNGNGATASDSESDSGAETETEYTQRETIKRDRNESKEDKKARKTAAKEQKQARKVEKAGRKAAFADERRRQVKIEAGRVKEGGAADVRVGAGKRLN